MPCYVLRAVWYLPKGEEAYTLDNQHWPSVVYGRPADDYTVYQEAWDGRLTFVSAHAELAAAEQAHQTLIYRQAQEAYRQGLDLPAEYLGEFAPG